MEDRILDHYLEEFAAGIDIDPVETETLFGALIGSTNQTLIAEVLTGWNEKGITEDELFEFASLMRSRMHRINSPHKTFVDLVGTGGSSSKSFNVSTAAAFVIAGSGVPVAKHGNRSATSRSGSADVLSKLGLVIDADIASAQRHLEQNSLCFMFSPLFHSLSPTLAMARRSIGLPTIFNNLGPLCNPASAPHHVIGVWSDEVLEKTANVLLRLGAERSWVVHGEGGLDEIALGGKTLVAEIDKGKVTFSMIAAAEFEVFTLGKDLPAHCSAEKSAKIIREVLDNKHVDRDTERLVLINAAAAIYVAGAAASLPDAYKKAEESLRSGAAMGKLRALTGALVK